jgi:glycine betaine/proline transport system substrate-binding protein
VARTGFYQDNVETASFFSRVQIPIDDLQKAMYDAQETSYAEAVSNYIEQNPDRINYWISGEL